MHLHGTRQLLLDAPHARLHQLARLDERLLALAEAVSGAVSGIIGAFGWASSRHLRGVTKKSNVLIDRMSRTADPNAA